jgi:hypothetical protein
MGGVSVVPTPGYRDGSALNVDFTNGVALHSRQSRSKATVAR